MNITNKNTENKPMMGADECGMRSCLKTFRCIATMIQSLLDLENDFTKQGLEVPAEERRKVEQILQARPWIKRFLLTIEGMFVQKGWSLPRWKRLGWLLEFDLKEKMIERKLS